MIVRRWAPDTLLNGRTFTDCPLEPGDRLSIGRVQFEVLPGDNPSPELPDYGAEQRGPARSIEAKHVPGMAELEARLALANRQGWQRSRRLLRELRVARKQAESQSPLSATMPVKSALDDGMAGRQRRLDQQSGELDHRELELIRQAEQLQERERQVEGQVAELGAERQALDEARSRFEAERAKAKAEVDQQTVALVARQADLQAALDDFQQRQRDWQEQREQDAAELDDGRRALHVQRDGLRAEREILETERKRFEQERAERESRMCAEPERGWPSPEEMPQRGDECQAVALDGVEILRKLGAMPQVDDEDSPPGQVPLPAAPAAVHAGESIAGGEDESVDQYMARLLQRVRGESSGLGSQQLAEQASSPPVEPEPERESPENSEGATCSDPAMPAAVGFSLPRPPAPRAVAPERHAGLSAMRELANFSAQAALHQHHRGKMIRATRMKLLVSVSGLATGVLMLWAWWFRLPSGLVLYGALTSLMVAIIWGVHYALLTGWLIVNRAGHLNWAWVKREACRDEAAPVDGKRVAGGDGETVPLAMLSDNVGVMSENGFLNRGEF